jgi:hypothetical protein
VVLLKIGGVSMLKDQETENTKQEIEGVQADNQVDEKTAKVMVEKGSTKKDAEKEVAKEEVKSQTGVSIDELSGVARKVMNMSDGLDGGRDLLKDSENSLQSSGVKNLVEKMQNSEVAQNVVKAGLGSEHLATGSKGLEDATKKVLDKGVDNKGVSQDRQNSGGLKDRLAKAAYMGMGMPKQKQNLDFAMLKKAQVSR